MSKIIFTKEEIEILESNVNVTKCSGQSISYSNDFKVEAVRKYNVEGLTPQGIFFEAGFDLDMIGRNKPCGCLKRWIAIYKQKGIAGLKIDLRHIHSGRKKFDELQEKEKIKRLEAEVAYLKAENVFLVKLRAKRSE